MHRRGEIRGSVGQPGLELATMKPAFLFLIAAFAYAAPCTTAAPDCTEWVALAGGPSRSLIYRTYSLDAKNEQISRALIVIHGQGRDADNYFRTSLAAAFDDTVVVAPRFASNDGRECRDTLAEDEVSWSCSGDSWRSGGAAASNPKLTSYDFADAILRKSARKEIYPN